MVKNIGFLSCTVKVRPKTVMSTSKRDEQPRHFHMGVPLPTKEQDRDDERKCLMACYNKIPNKKLFTLRRQVAETCPICDDPLFKIGGGAVSFLNRRAGESLFFYMN